jgi:hypothetical protein
MVEAAVVVAAALAAVVPRTGMLKASATARPTAERMVFFMDGFLVLG